MDADLAATNDPIFLYIPPDPFLTNRDIIYLLT